MEQENKTRRIDWSRAGIEPRLQENLLVDEGRWLIDLLVIDTGNWLPGRNVVISPRSLRAVDWTEQRIEVDLPRDSIEHSPEYKPPADQNFLMRLFDHYGLTRQI